MTRIYYKGPLQAVEIAELGVIVEHGKSVDVDPDLADRLNEQADWHIRGTSKEITKESD